MDEKLRGIIFNIQRYSIHDGPGVRTNVFLKGCPLRCLWCSNPEGQKKVPEIMFMETYCVKCGKCTEVCPNGANKFLENKVVIERDICQGCGKCVEVCPTKAREVVGKYVSVEDVLKEVEKDSLLYRNSGGGITVTGGEPTSQPEFLEALLKEAHIRGIDAVLETCAYISWQKLEPILEYIDVVLFDIKHINPIIHKKYTGVSNNLILENAIRIKQKGVPLVVRLPLIPGFNASQESIRAIGKFAQGLHWENRIDLLPYHAYGAKKYEKLEREYHFQGKTLNKGKVEECKRVLEMEGLKVEIV